MKPVLKKGLLAFLSICFATCLSLGIAACNPKEDNVEHSFSEEWSHDDVAHWHASTDGSDAISGYEEHVPKDEGTVVGEYIYYVCDVCGVEYRSTSFTYILYVKNIGNAGVTGVSVKLYDSNNKLVSNAVSGMGGIVRFRNLNAADYTAVIDKTTFPLGYDCADDQLNVEFTKDVRSQTVSLTPHLITGTEMPSGTSYSLGSVVYDFEYSSYYKDGSTGKVKLSDYLDKYNAVVLQFFFTTCQPCLKEFPYMNQVYNLTESSTGDNYYDKIGLIEFDYNGFGDTIPVLQNFIAGDLGYQNFAYVYDSPSNYYTNYGVTGFPTTVVIDRYGVVAYMESNSQPSVTHWTNLFEKFMTEDYVPDYSEPDIGDSDTPGNNMVKPDVYMPESSDIVDAIVTKNDYTTAETFKFSEYLNEDGLPDEYSWPWLISGDNDQPVNGVNNYIYSSNANKLGSYSIIVIDVTLREGQALMFDYMTSTELDADYLYIQVDTVLQAQLSGVTGDWQTFYYVARHTGDYQITLTYVKDTSIDEIGDRIYVSNMCLGLASDEITDKTALSIPDLLYNAATAYSSDGGKQYGPGYGYPDYVSVYLSSDGFYHVDVDEKGKTDGSNPENDPFLLADLYYTTPWNNLYSIWNIAFAFIYTSEEGGTDTDIDNNKGILYENHSYAQAIEDYTWVQTSCEWNYVPINEELATIMKAVVKSYGTVDQEKNENQWLEACRYYMHYGAAHTDGDSCFATDNLALTYGFKMPKYEGSVGGANTEGNEFTFHANAKVPILPRGFYYSITAETTGVYLVYTNEKASSKADPYVMVTDADGRVIVSNDDYDLSVAYSGFVDPVNYNNSYMYAYLKAGETYMIGCCMSDAEDTGEFDVYIRYLDEELTYFTPVTNSYFYTQDLETYRIYVPTLFSDYYVDDDGYYWAYNDDGTATPIYVNMTDITYLYMGYTSMTIEELINAGVWKGASNITMRDYLTAAKNNTAVTSDGVSLEGFIHANTELVELLNYYINGGNSDTVADYADTAWMLTAFYERTINTYKSASERDK